MDIAKWLEGGALFSLNNSEILVSYGDVVLSTNQPQDSHGYFLPDFYLSSEQSWYQFKENHIITKKALLTLIEGLKLQSTTPNYKWQPPSKEEFSSNFTKIQNEIWGGKLNKLVPVVFEVSDDLVKPEDLVYFINKLLTVDTSQQVYGFWSNGEGLLGLTPEVLFNKTESKITSMALAGTDKVTSGDGSLLSNTKEMNEHNFVIDNLNNNLKPIGRFSKSKTYEWAINEIKHLRTDIEVDLSHDVKPGELIKAMHPTPALGVHPKDYNWKNIKNFETKVNRSRYGAPIGVSLPGGEFKSVVAIRNLQWDQKNSYIGSGCGIVKESELEKEWSELILKRNSVKKYLGLINK